jgi:hypothetical protein
MVFNQALDVKKEFCQELLFDRMKTAGFLKAEVQTFILLLKDIIIGLTAAAAKQDKRF